MAKKTVLTGKINRKDWNTVKIEAHVVKKLWDAVEAQVHPSTVSVLINALLAQHLGKKIPRGEVINIDELLKDWIS